MQNFWSLLTKPFSILAPVDGYTDPAYRALVAEIAKPDVLVTEFVSADGLCSVGKEHLLQILRFTEAERPIVAQLFGAHPDNMERAAALVAELGFDGIDLNMGCPERIIVTQGAGADLIRQPGLAVKLIKATIRGAAGLPVSVKTRIGFGQNEVSTWIPSLLETGITALTLHGRTRTAMYSGTADWNAIAEAAKLAREAGVLVIGNGDVSSLEDGRVRARQYGTDGFMVARGALGNPYCFAEAFASTQPDLGLKLKAMTRHLELFARHLADARSFVTMRKHFVYYLRGYDNTKDLKMALMLATTAADVERLVQDFAKHRGIW